MYWPDLAGEAMTNLMNKLRNEAAANRIPKKAARLDKDHGAAKIARTGQWAELTPEQAAHLDRFNELHDAEQRRGARRFTIIPQARRKLADHKEHPLDAEETGPAAPLSFTGITTRLWPLLTPQTYLEMPWWAKTLLAVTATLALGVAWAVVLAWYLTFGLIVVPWRIARRDRNETETWRRAELTRT